MIFRVNVVLNVDGIDPIGQLIIGRLSVKP